MSPPRPEAPTLPRLRTVTGRADQVLQSPGMLVGLLIAAQLIAWTLAPALTHSAPPLDVVEGYMWGREWVVATYKHPALPSWTLETARSLTGTVGWPAYLVSQLFVVTTFIFVYLLGCDLVGPRRAAAGTLLLTGVVYFAWPTPEFNHNVAALPFWAAMPWALWRAVERGGILWWALAGALAAGGLYTKLTTVLLLATIATWMLWDARARKGLTTPGPWLGLVVFALLAAPLALWLISNDFAPLRYAVARTGVVHTTGVPLFVLGVALNLVGLLAMLVFAGLIGPWRRSAAARTAPDPPPDSVAPRGLEYLIFLIGGPLALTIILALATNAGLKSAWGSSMFDYAGVLAVALTSARFDDIALRRIAIAAAALICIVPLGYSIAIAVGPLREAMPPRVSWPQADIAERMTAVWARETGRPLGIVAGDDWVAGLVGITASDRPSILNEGDLAFSPWITPERIARQGMLIVWEARSRRIPVLLQPLVAAHPTGEESFKWGRPNARRDLVIGYSVVAPEQPR